MDAKRSIYIIHVRGELDPAWSAWFDGMSIKSSNASGDTETVISGPVSDQAHLRGILNKLWDLNLELVSVSIEDDQ